METKTLHDRVLFLVGLAVVAGIVSYALYFLKAPDINDHPLSVVSGPAPVGNSTGQAMAVYTNTEYGFSFQYKKDFKITELNNGTVDLVDLKQSCPFNAECLQFLMSVSAVRMPIDMPISAYIERHRDVDSPDNKKSALAMPRADAIKVTILEEGGYGEIREYYIKPEGKDYMIIVWEAGYPAEGAQLVQSLRY